MIEDSDLLHEFVLEAKAHISEMETGLLAMEQGVIDKDAIHGMFRAAHSIKGTAGFFALNKIVDLAHSMESVLGELREQRISSSTKMIDELLAALDVLKVLLEAPQDSEEYDITEHMAALGRLSAEAGQGTKAGTEDSFSAWDVWNELTEMDNEQSAGKSDIKEAPPVSIPEAASPLKEVHALPTKKEFTEDSVRVNVGLLNDLLTIAGEMVLRRNQLLRIADAAGREAVQLETTAQSIDELTTSLQKTIMQTRMQPIANVFNKFPRIVRDLSHKLGKEVDLKLEGLRVGLDRSLIEALVDPMTHLVRNALDHGIEKPSVRQENNKPAAGVLTLRAYQESGRVIVDITDDGAGIDLDKVKQLALRKGLIAEDEEGHLGQADVLNLIMRPGFSTSEEITDLSGRGVGMDVVKNNIEKLGGKIELFSEKGHGTTFRLLLPLTLAIIAAVIIVEQGQPYAIPLSNIKELLLIRPDEKKGVTVEKVYDQTTLRLRGKIMPLIRLRDILEGTAAPAKSLFDCFTLDRESLRVVIVKAGAKEYGLVVDAVYDNEEILVKPNEKIVSNCGLYSGATVLGDGSIAMILDTESHHITQKLAFFAAPALQDSVNQKVHAEEQYVLLFQCSGSEMLGLDLAMVSRVEEVDITKLKKIGTKYYFIFHGRTTRIIRPEHYLPLTRRKNQPTKVYVILPKLIKFPIGIMVEKIHDAVYTAISLESEAVVGKGILGSAIINGNMVTLLNIHELLTEAVPEYLSVSSREPQFSSTEAQSNRFTILLAEDTPFFLKVVKSYLEIAGYQVIAVENGQEALEILKTTSVDVVISDIEMPVMTGLELVRAIRADEGLKGLPVIALTSLRGEGDKEKGLRAGFDMYEHKLDRLSLLESIHTALSMREKSKEVSN